MNTRIEHDTMGEIAVPAEHHWGAQTQRSLENFKIGGQRQPQEIITAFAYLKEACAQANADCGKLTAEQAAAIGPVDAVLVPVGGVYTVDAAGAKAVCDALHPRCVVPMHYHHAPYGLTEVDSVEPFLELWPAEAVHHLQGAAFELTEQTAGVMVPSF